MAKKKTPTKPVASTSKSTGRRKTVSFTKKTGEPVSFKAKRR